MGDVRAQSFQPVSLGNHDAMSCKTTSVWAENYAADIPSIEAVPGGLKSCPPYYFSFDVANVHFICLYSQVTDYGDSLIHGRFTYRDQFNWLEQNLQNTTRPWKIALYHIPSYYAVRGLVPDSTRTDVDMFCMQKTFDWEIGKLFAQYGVQLTFSGHEHYYRRYPRRNIMTGKISDSGTMPVISGASSTPLGGEPYSCVLGEVMGDTIRIRSLDTAGVTLDQWELPLFGQPKTLLGTGIMKPERYHPIKSPVAIAPNPMQDRSVMRVSLSAPSSVEIRGFDNRGRLWFSTRGTYGKGEKIIPFPCRPPGAGVYFVRTEINGQIYGKRVVVLE
jgi:hypothetical protein